jgi:hypothetical protein
MRCTETENDSLLLRAESSLVPPQPESHTAAPADKFCFYREQCAQGVLHISPKSQQPEATQRQLASTPLKQSSRGSAEPRLWRNGVGKKGKAKKRLARGECVVCASHLPVLHCKGGRSSSARKVAMSEYSKSKYKRSSTYFCEFGTCGTQSPRVYLCRGKCTAQHMHQHH